MSLLDILERIESRLQTLGLSADTASELAGKPDAIRNLRRAAKSGNQQGVSTATLEALASVLQTTDGWLLTGDERMGGRLKQPDGTPIGATIKRLREERGISQAELAGIAGVSQQTIAAIETGKQRTMRKLPQIARALNVSASDLDPAYSHLENTSAGLLAEKLAAAEAEIAGLKALLADVKEDRDAWREVAQRLALARETGNRG